MQASESRTDIADRKARLSKTKLAILEAKLRGRGDEGAAAGTIPLRLPGETPLSFGQERIWFQCQVGGNAALYNIPMLVRLSGHLDFSALETCIDALIRRHEVLRTGFRNEAGRPVPFIMPAVRLTVERIGLGALDPALREAATRDHAAAEARKPFDLGAPPLLRVTLLALGPQEHVLLLTVHHIVWDGWSSGLLIREIGALYDAVVSRRPVPLPSLPVQYGDFACWQRRLFEGEEGAAQRAYWRRQLDGLPPLLALPTDRPRPPMQSHRGSTYSWRLPESVEAAAAELGRRKGATLFSTLLSVLKVLLFRYSGQDDIAVGTTIAYRTRPELEGLFGFFANSLVLRADLRGNPTFGTLLGRVHEVVLGAQSNQDVPFEKLVEELAPKRALSHNPLFQVAFVHHNLPTEKLALPALTIATEETSTNAAAFDLVLHVFNERPGLRMRFEYDADLFDEATIIRMARHFDLLLEGFLRDPERRLGEIPLLSAEEEEQALAAARGEAVALPEGLLLHHLIEAAARDHSHRPAVASGTETLTYRELVARAGSLARELRSLGVKPDIPVGLCVAPSVDMIVGMIGILMAGGAYVPLDPAYPAARIGHVLEEAGAALLVTSHAVADTVPDAGPPRVYLDRDWTEAGFPGPASPLPPPDADDLAYIIYTSGSTGRPKGVMVSHRNAVASTLARNHTYRAPVGAFLLLSSIAFDSSVAGIFWTLAQGGCLRIPGEAERRDPAALVRTIREGSVSHLLCLPSLYSILLEQLSSAECATLRCVIVAGEECKREMAARHFERHPAVSLFNEYGPTECTVWSTVHEIRHDEAEGPVTIGRPIANTRLHVLDPRGMVLPVGVPGEIFIGGAGVVRGYHGQPDATASRFLPDPFGSPGGRLYRTGDRGRRRSDGDIEFLGRTDNQVKLRGYRIEPGEIEEILLRHSSVADAAVVLRPDKAGNPRLVAYAVPVPGSRADGEDCKRHLRERLPEFMVPGQIVLLDEFPLLPNGKVDRSALPEPPEAEAGARMKEEENRTGSARLLAEIWCEVLSVEAIRDDDNFFDLGGNSLSAIQVVARVQQLFDREIPVDAIFGGGTFRVFADEVERFLSQESDAELEALLDELEDLSEPGMTKMAGTIRRDGEVHA